MYKTLITFGEFENIGVGTDHGFVLGAIVIFVKRD
jgi:hypothetical protein